MFTLSGFADEISQDLAHACQVCREYEVEGVEIRSVWDTPVQDLTPEQVREAYEADKESYFIPEKVKYSVIVLNKGATPEDQAVKQAEAESIRKRLVEGADFAETAKAVSEGSRAAEGGA